MSGVLRLLRDSASPGRVVVVATHDERLLPIADRVIELSAARRDAIGSRRITLAKGEILFEEGQPGDVAYIVEEGMIELVRRRADGVEEVVLAAGRGRWFGELAPLYGLPRTATARAPEASVVTACPPHLLRQSVQSALNSR